MGGQTYNFQILSVLGDVSNWDSQFRLVSRAIMIPFVVFLTLPALVWQWFSRTASSYRTDWWSNKNHVCRIGSRQLCKLHWWQTQSKNQDVSLVPPRVNGKLKPGAAMAIPPDFPEKNGVSAGLGAANRGFFKGGLRLGTFWDHLST